MTGNVSMILRLPTDTIQDGSLAHTRVSTNRISICGVVLELQYLLVMSPLL